MKYDNFIRLEVLTPVHIGSGDSSDPLDYVITTQNDEDYFCRIDLDAWLEDYPEQAELTKLLDSGNLPKIRQYIAANLDADIYARTSARIISAEIGKKYRKNIANSNSPNQLLIDPALKNPLTGGLLIPGSSIKGAMRTAVIDWCDQNWGLKLNTCRNPREYTQKLEQALGSIGDSAFKQLKIGDFEAVNGDSAIVTAKEKSIKAAKAGGTPKNSCEVSLSTATERQQQALFGRFAIGKQNLTDDVLLSCKMGTNRKQWSLPELMQLVNDFYAKRYRAEKSNFYQQAHFSASRAVISMLDEQFSTRKEHQMILRVGHYSHIECMTVTDNKPQGKKGFGKTRTLADGVYPFGWVKLSLCSKDEYEHYWQLKQRREQQLTQQRQELRQVKIEQRQQLLQRQLELQRQKDHAEQQRREQEADELANPWKQVVRRMAEFDNWGDFKQQVLEKTELAEFRQISEFTQAVYEQVVSIRAAATKWDEQRDELIVQWFEPAAQQWQRLAAAADPQVVQLDEQQQQLLEMVASLSDWGAYKSSSFALHAASLPVLQALKSRFESWGCDSKKAKKDKRAAWQDLRKMLQKAKHK